MQCGEVGCVKRGGGSPPRNERLRTQIRWVTMSPTRSASASHSARGQISTVRANLAVHGSGEERGGGGRGGEMGRSRVVAMRRAARQLDIFESYS